MFLASTSQFSTRHHFSPSKGLYMRNLNSPSPPSLLGFLLDLLRQLALLVPNFVLVAVGQGDVALAVLKVVLPATLVLGAAGIGHRALAILEPLLPFTLVLLAVGPGVGTLAVHLVVLVFALILFRRCCQRFWCRGRPPCRFLKPPW